MALDPTSRELLKQTQGASTGGFPIACLHQCSVIDRGKIRAYGRLKGVSL